MTTQEIREKLTKAQEVVTKKEAWLVKLNAKAEKIAKQIEVKGWDINGGRYQKENTAEHEDCYWTFCDYDGVLGDIKRTERTIEEKKEVVAKWATKLAETEKKEATQESFPEILKSFQQSVIEMWDKWDTEKQAFYKAELKRMEEEYTGTDRIGGYRAFIKRYTHRAYEFAYLPFETIHKDNVRASENLLMNLWNRVKEKVGEATDWAGLYVTQGNEWEGAVVNGVVKGTKGTAYVETIGAGGWNIQKFHYRTLVK